MMDLTQLTSIAIKAALSAGDIIREHIHAEVSVNHKQAGNTYASQVVTEVDRQCEDIIISILQPSCDVYGLGLLSEETIDDGSRFTKDAFWCIDPMDGTLAFINKRPGYAVSIALVARDGTPMIGVVYDPITATLYHAIKGGGAYKNRSPWSIDQSNQYLTYVTDKELEDTPQKSSIEKKLNHIARKSSLHSIQECAGGGAVMNAIYVLENGPAVMMKLPKEELGGGSIWDYAATACIYAEMGLRATDYAGRSLDLNRVENTFMNQEGVWFANIEGDMDVR